MHGSITTIDKSRRGPKLKVVVGRLGKNSPTLVNGSVMEQEPTKLIVFVGPPNKHKQCAPFGRRTGLTAGHCCGRYGAGFSGTAERPQPTPEVLVSRISLQLCLIAVIKEWRYSELNRLPDDAISDGR